MTTPDPLPSPRDHIVISGFGLMTPLGHSAWETFSALLAGRSLTDRAAALPPDTSLVDLVRAVGCVSVVQHSAADPTIDLAEHAAREALFMAGCSEPGLPAMLGASKGAVGALELALPNHVRSLRQAAPADAPLAAALGPHAYLAHHLRQRLHLGPIRTFVAACASSLTALHHARLELLSARADRPQRLLVMTAEAALYPVFIHSYRRLGVLGLGQSDHEPLPAVYRCRPLDERRSGFVLAELGAAVVLERVNHVQPGQIELLDTAVASETYDLIRPDPAMPALAHVANRLIANRRLDLLHPHATGTADQDPIEMRVYADACGLTQPHPPQHLPDVYACKGSLGHGLGAAGLVSLILACLCAKSRRRPPMPWLDQPLPGPWNLSAAPAPLPPASTHALFAAGFGGHVAGAVIREQQ